MSADKRLKAAIGSEAKDQIAERALIIGMQMGIRLVQNQDLWLKKRYVGQYLGCLQNRSPGCVNLKPRSAGKLKKYFDCLICIFVKIYLDRNSIKDRSHVLNKSIPTNRVSVKHAQYISKSKICVPACNNSAYHTWR